MVLVHRVRVLPTTTFRLYLLFLNVLFFLVLSTTIILGHVRLRLTNCRECPRNNGIQAPPLRFMDSLRGEDASAGVRDDRAFLSSRSERVLIRKSSLPLLS